MSELSLLKLDHPVQPADYYLPAEKCLAGNPRQTLWLEYTDPSGQFMVGVWRSEPGKWRITYTEEEYCQMLEGRSIVTDASGHAVTVAAGESFVIPRGFEGTWEGVETTRKRFVLYEATDRIPTVPETSMVLTVFRSRLREESRADYQAEAARMSALAPTMPGYRSHKTFIADDGERVTIVEFEDAASQRAWAMQPEHQAAQRQGREAFYSEYSLQICEVVRESRFKA